jgi:ABC-type molybdate transport system ATPase subunit
MLMLDEPLAALDIATKSRILDDLRKWNAVRGIPILYVTHSPAEAFAVGEAVVAMGSGRILAQGTPQEVLIAPRHESIAQIVGFENVFEAAVQSIEEAQGTMICELAGSRTLLEVPLSDVAPGDAVRIAIRAGDIILAVEQPGRMSARNCIAGQLTSIGREGVKVIANVAAGATFEVHLTPASAVALDLKVGSPVWMIIKTYSCNLVRGGRGASETLGDEPDRG